MLGSPVSHSLSPTLHRAAYAALGLDWVYDAHEVDEAGLPSFLGGLDDSWRGLSLTMPLKQTAIDLCRRVEEQARLVGAVNTLLVGPAGELEGLNTDIPGFVAAWRRAGITQASSAGLLGSGATARSAVAAMADIGVHDVTVVVRSPERAATLVALAERLRVSVTVVGISDAGSLGDVDLLVSTLPAGSFVGDLSSALDGLLDRAAAVSDVVYHPRDAPLLAAARRRGIPTVEGFELLLQQAVLQVEAMTGCQSAPVEPMRQAGLVELLRREGET